MWKGAAHEAHVPRLFDAFFSIGTAVAFGLEAYNNVDDFTKYPDSCSSFVLVSHFGKGVLYAEAVLADA